MVAAGGLLVVDLAGVGVLAGVELPALGASVGACCPMIWMDEPPAPGSLVCPVALDGVVEPLPGELPEAAEPAVAEPCVAESCVAESWCMATAAPPVRAAAIRAVTAK